jgi:NitT/TauT family transport system ATP-binding protein
VIETGWPRERDSQIVSVPEFGTITARLWTLLRVQSMQSLRPEAV